MDLEQISSTDFEFEAGRLNDLASQQAWKLDSALHVQFYKHAELNSFASEKEGRKKYDEHVYIRILSPANRLNVIERRATDEDRQRFSRQFKAFVERGEQLLSGTLLTELPGMSPGQVLEYKALKVETVEQLAGMSDGTAQLLGTGGVEMKQRAIRFLDERQSSVKLSESNRELRDRIAELERLVADRLKAPDTETKIAVSATAAAK